MDKFGIYNLLNSFLGAFGAQKSESGDRAADSFSARTEQKPEPNPSPAPATPPAVFPPLQAGMLSVMREHDEFIKRVKAKSDENKR